MDPKFPLEDSCRVHGISSRFPLPDIRSYMQVEIQEIFKCYHCCITLPDGLLATCKHAQSYVLLAILNLVLELDSIYIATSCGL